MERVVNITKKVFYVTLALWALSMLSIMFASIAELLIDKELVLPCLYAMYGCVFVFFIEGLIYLIELYIDSYK